MGREEDSEALIETVIWPLAKKELLTPVTITGSKSKRVPVLP